MGCALQGCQNLPAQGCTPSLNPLFTQGKTKHQHWAHSGFYILKLLIRSRTAGLAEGVQVQRLLWWG